MKRALAECHSLRDAQIVISKAHCPMQLSAGQIATLSDQDLVFVASKQQ